MARADTEVAALHVSGFGDIQMAFFDHGPNQNRQGGSQADRRLVFDLTRFMVKFEGELPHDIEFEAEIEFEHGGTGSALELEYEEFGEFGNEVEKGGEILLEELYVQKTFDRWLSVKLGRFYVATGIQPDARLPTDYLASTRSEAENRVLPESWNEIGVSATAHLGWGRLTAQVVSGLDSSGFSSQRWVASGHQGRFELVRATDLALVGRLDVTTVPGTLLGASVYYGGTSRNRPKPDLVHQCDDPDPDAVAPCGWLDAPVFIASAHARIDAGPVRATALLLWGHLANAGDISVRNDRLSNALGVLRSPVASEAVAAWAEIGVDIAPWLCLDEEHRLEPYLRLDHYDTMFGVDDGQFDNPRFERTVVTTGAGYTLADAYFAKLDFSHRRLGSSAFRTENTVRLSTGFLY